MTADTRLGLGELPKAITDSLRKEDGFSDESLLTEYAERVVKGIQGPDKLPRELRGGEKAYIWPAIHHETVVTIVDEAWGRPIQTIFYEIEPSGALKDIPVRIVDDRYDLDIIHYPIADYAGVGMTVVRHTMETWEGSSQKKQRTGLNVIRVIYNQGKSEKIFAPYLLICKSVFEKAPASVAGMYSTRRETWLEVMRIFDIGDSQIAYGRSEQSGDLELRNNYDARKLGEVKKLLGTLGGAEIRVLPVKIASYGG